jgi:hypothetical protein
MDKIVRSTAPPAASLAVAGAALLTARLRAIAPHHVRRRRVLGVLGAGCLDATAIVLTTIGGIPFAVASTALAALGWAAAGRACAQSPRRTFSRPQRERARTDHE